MKINEIINEGVLGSIGKGLADIVAPGAVEKYQAANRNQAIDQKAQASQPARQNILRQANKYDKFADLYAQRLPTVNGSKTTSMQDIARTLPKSGETADPNQRWKAVQYIAQQLATKGIKISNSPTPPVATTTPQPTAALDQSINVNNIQPATRSGQATAAEQAKLQQKIQAALAAQQK